MNGEGRAEFQVRFGRGGNLQEYGITGWGRPDERVTWTTGQDSRLWLPRPADPGTYALKLSVRPFPAAEGGAVQTLTVLVNGQKVGEFGLAASAIFECRLPWELIVWGETIAVHFLHPHAGAGDLSPVGFEEVSLVRAEEAPAPARAAAPPAVTRGGPGSAAETSADRAGVAGFVTGLRGTCVEGWAIASPDLAECRIEVRDSDSGALLGRALADIERAELRRLGYRRSNFAFRVDLQIAGRPVRNARVLADGVELPGSPIPIDLQRFAVELRIEDGYVRGSVADSFGVLPPPPVTLRDQDGRDLGEVLHQPPAGGGPGRAPFVVALPATSYGQPEYLVRALIGGREIGYAIGDLRLDGFLDRLTPELCSGWLLLPNAPGVRPRIEIWRDGRLVVRARCNQPRPDLRGRYPNAWHCGFEAELLPPYQEFSPAQISIRLADTDFELFEGPFTVGRRAALIDAAHTAVRLASNPDLPLSVNERAVIRAAIAGFCKEQRGAEEEYGRLAGVTVAGRDSAATNRRLNIVIPVYRGVAITQDCIASVLRHRRADIDSVIIVNDCSPEPEMAGVLRQFLREPNVFLLSNGQNLGFIRSVNRALQFCQDGDVLLLNSDTTVFAGGFDELCRIAHSAGDIATVTAMSNNATIFTYPDPGKPVRSLADITWAELAEVALRENAGAAIDVPTGHGFCLLLKRALINRLGLLNEVFGRGYGEENEWCRRATDLGYRHVAAAGVFVEHREAVSFGSKKDELVRANLALLATMYREYGPVIEEYERRDDLRRARWALDGHRLERACAAGARYALVIEHSLGGGTATAIADIERAVGYGSSRKLGLMADENGKVLLKAADPPVKAVFRPEDAEALFALLKRIDIDLVLIHQLLGFGREFIAGLARYVEGRRAVLFVHDFYSFCPRATMIDAAGEFCNQSDPAVCGRCVELAGSHENSALTELPPAAHRALFGQLMSRVQRIVAPSDDAAARLAAVFPGMPITAIPHPQSHIRLGRQPASGSFDNVVLLGALGPHKGSAALLDIARRARLSQPRLRFHVIGYTDLDDELREIGNVEITGAFEPEVLPELIAAADGRIALFLHGWPETFSYTLSEAAAHGLIPLVPDIGAPAERVRAAGFGVVFPFPIEAAAVLDTIHRVATGALSFGTGDPTQFATPSSAAAIRDLFAVAPENARSGRPAGKRPAAGAAPPKKPRNRTSNAGEAGRI